MGASVPYYVRVLTTTEKWITVDAVCSWEAQDIAENERGVIQVLEIRVDCPAETDSPAETDDE